MLASYLILVVAFYFFFIVGLGVSLFMARKNAVQQGRIDGKYFKTYEGGIPKDLKQFENNFNNQFQAPIVFMIVCLAGIQFKTVTPVFLTLACLFVISRLIHSYVHITSNKILFRAGSYFSGIILISILWILVLIRALSGTLV